MSLNERINELKIYLETVFSEGVNLEEEESLIIKRFEKDLDVLEIHKMINNHNNKFTRNFH